MMDRLPITHVAIRFQGKIWSLPKPNRHHNVIRHIVEQTKMSHVDAYGEDQGFLDEAGTYLNRKQALMNAEMHNQLLPDKQVMHEELYSENLW